jgi:hypothetical protein
MRSWHTVVGISAKAEPPAGQLLVEIVEHEVAQKGRKRAALRRAFIHRTDQAVLHHPGIEERPDEFEHALSAIRAATRAIRPS